MPGGVAGVPPIREAPYADGAPSIGAHLRVQAPLRAGHSEQSEVQLREGDRAWEGCWRGSNFHESRSTPPLIMKDTEGVQMLEG